MSFSPSKTAYTMTYAALISHLRGMADSIRKSLSDEQCRHDSAQAHRVLEVLLLGIRMAEDCMAEVGDINALVDRRINEIQEERAPFVPVPASLDGVEEEEDVEMMETKDNEEEILQHQGPDFSTVCAGASPAQSEGSSLPDLSRFQSPTSPTPRPARRTSNPLTPKTRRSRQWTDIRTLLADDLESYIDAHANDTQHELEYHETIRALNEAYAIAAQEPSTTEPEDLWSTVQDDIHNIHEIAHAQRDARKPVSVLGSDDAEDNGVTENETPYHSSGRPVEESWHPFMPVSPGPAAVTLSALASLGHRTYDFEPLVGFPCDVESRRLVRSAIECTLDGVLNASEIPELHDVVRAYWDYVETEMPSPAPSE